MVYRGGRRRGRRRGDLGALSTRFPAQETDGPRRGPGQRSTMDDAPPPIAPAPALAARPPPAPRCGRSPCHAGDRSRPGRARSGRRTARRPARPQLPPRHRAPRRRPVVKPARCGCSRWWPWGAGSRRQAAGAAVRGSGFPGRAALSRSLALRAGGILSGGSVVSVVPVVPAVRRQLRSGPASAPPPAPVRSHPPRSTPPAHPLTAPGTPCAAYPTVPRSTTSNEPHRDGTRPHRCHPATGPVPPAADWRADDRRRSAPRSDCATHTSATRRHAPPTGAGTATTGRPVRRRAARRRTLADCARRGPDPADHPTGSGVWTPGAIAGIVGAGPASAVLSIPIPRSCSSDTTSRQPRPAGRDPGCPRRPRSGPGGCARSRQGLSPLHQRRRSTRSSTRSWSSGTASS